MYIKRSIKVLVIVIVAFAFASVVTAYAASNTVNVSTAGDGAGNISGYTISDVHYTLDTDPQNIASVRFTTSPAVPSGSTVKIQLATSGSWYDTCSGQGSTSISCTTSGATVNSANSLHIVIAN